MRARAWRASASLDDVLEQLIKDTANLSLALFDALAGRLPRSAGALNQATLSDARFCLRLISAARAGSRALRLEVLLGQCGLILAFRDGSGDIDLTVLADQDPGSAVTGGTDCLQGSRDIGLLESRRGSGHVLQPAESALFWSLALLCPVLPSPQAAFFTALSIA